MIRNTQRESNEQIKYFFKYSNSLLGNLIYHIIVTTLKIAFVSRSFYAYSYQLRLTPFFSETFIVIGVRIYKQKGSSLRTDNTDFAFYFVIVASVFAFAASACLGGYTYMKYRYD